MSRFLLIVLILCSVRTSTAQENIPLTARSAAPALTASLLDGSHFQLSDHKGKVVALVFWATWCGPCKKLLPVVDQAFKDQRGAGLVALAIAIDDAQTLPQVRSTVKRYGWALPVASDPDGNLASALNPRGLAPFLVLIDRQGRVAFTQEGFTPEDEPRLKARLTALMSETAH